VPRTRQSEPADQRDRELLGELAAGRPEVLAELFDRHGASLFRHGLALCRRQADAEDLVQATFLKLATTGADLGGVRSPASYLHRMLHMTWVDGQRRTIAGERVVEQAASETDARPSPIEDAIDIGRALDALAEAQREAIVLHLVEGFSFREIGRATGVSLFTAAARYRLGLARLRTKLGRSRGGRA
jgi:RNA polymerase sigma-70 factor (ECF subfamily)